MGGLLPLGPSDAVANLALPTLQEGTLCVLAAWSFSNEGWLRMAGLTEEDVRKRAYEIWKGAGEPNEKMDAFWYEAEKELLAERSEQGDVPPGMSDNLPV